MTTAEKIKQVIEALEVIRKHHDSAEGFRARTVLRDLSRDAAASLREVLAEVENPWRPIETAPKDGTKVWIGNHAGVCVSSQRNTDSRGSNGMPTTDYSFSTINGMWPTHWKHFHLPTAPQEEHDA